MNKLFEYPEQLLWDRQLQILQADATKQCILEENSVDLIVTSPPYNLGKATVPRQKRILSIMKIISRLQRNG